MNVLSLFDGISCGQVALERSEIPYSSYYASEIEPSAIKVTQANYPATIQVGDVSALSPDTLPQIDLLIGGSPCQGFSFAGKQLNFDDPRSRLFFEYLRLKNELQPCYWLLENVKMKRESRDVISESLGVEPILIDSADFSAQSRPRLYWTNIPIEKYNSCTIKPLDILEGDLEPNSTAWHRWWEKNSDFQISKSYSRIMNEASKAVCLTTRQVASWNGNLVRRADGSLRFLSPLEAERLQTLPDHYTSTVRKSERYKHTGNGWTVDVIAHIFKGLKNSEPQPDFA